MAPKPDVRKLMERTSATLEDFQGLPDDDVRAWIRRFDIFQVTQEWSDARALGEFKLRMKGPASDWLELQSDQADLKELMASLKKQFVPNEKKQDNIQEHMVQMIL